MIKIDKHIKNIQEVASIISNTLVNLRESNA